MDATGMNDLKSDFLFFLRLLQKVNNVNENDKDNKSDWFSLNMLKIHCVLKASVMILGIQREFSILLLQWMNFTSVVYRTDKIKIWFMQGLI